MYHIRKRHPGMRLEVIIDRKALQKTLILWRFISAVYDAVYVADNHSKILVIDAGAGRLAALVTSQNLTRGNRHESAVLSTDPNITEPLLADYFDLRKNRAAPMHDIMPISESEGSRELVPAAADNFVEPTEEPTAESEIERMAGIFAPLTDIATVMGVSPSRMRDIIADPDHPWSRAYRVGKAKAKITLRAKEMEFANAGSPIAIQNVRENLIDMEADEE